MNVEAERADTDAENASLRRRVAVLEAQVGALADANAVAAELMAELDEAHAVEAALRRRTEELNVQRAVDHILVGSDDANELALALLRGLTGTDALDLTGDALLLLREGDRLRECAAVGDTSCCREHLDACWRVLSSEAPGEWSEDGRVLIVLRGSDRRLGVLCLRCRPGLAWRDRWLGLLLSFGAQIGVALERLQVEAHNRQLVVELAAACDRAQAATRAKDQFLSTMSHELRTPLNAIIGYGELLLEDRTDIKTDVGRIISSGKHLLTLVSEVLDLAKIEAGKVELCWDRFAVGPMVREIAEMALPMVDSNGSTLEVALDDAVGVMEADAGKLRQILLNLLSNAAKFTQRGAIRLIVAPCSDDDDSLIVFRVTDTGIGMTEEQLARVFEPFVQADPTTTRRYGGTGLGLSICGHFAALMGGTIAVQSVPGQGTTFELVMPRWRGDGPGTGARRARQP
jgi:signal transduction histidine kinase